MTDVLSISSSFYVSCQLRPSSLSQPFPRWLSGKKSAYQCRRCGFDPEVRKIPWRSRWQPAPVFLSGKSLDRGAWWATVHGVAKDLDTTSRLNKCLKIESIFSYLRNWTLMEASMKCHSRRAVECNWKSSRWKVRPWQVLTSALPNTSFPTLDLSAHLSGPQCSHL